MPHINSKIGGKPFVAGSVGPYGACLCDGSEYNGNYLKPDHPNSKPLGTDKTRIREFLRNWHRDRIKVNTSRHHCARLEFGDFPGDSDIS